MRANLPSAEFSIVARQIETSPFVDELSIGLTSFSKLDASTLMSILEEAAKFADTYLQPLNDAGDKAGCTLGEDGRVRTCNEHKQAWEAFREAGWLGLDMPESYGGQGLPLALALGVQELFDRSCSAFGMMLVPIRSAVKLLGAWAPEDLAHEWIPQLVSGEVAATICISEPQAGSDAQRIRTRADQGDDGVWRLSGQKCWISFGDHDATDQIGQCVLARTPGSKGLSLFLVPSERDGKRNGLSVLRIEEKMGLHASPTCVLEFEKSEAFLLGEEGRGLAQMFVMITNMRLSVGAQGVGIASGALDVAMQYAKERGQGGRGEAPIVIVEHADVQRMLMEMASAVDTTRGMGLAIATISEYSSLCDEARRKELVAFVQWMLPIFKTAGSRAAFEVSSEAMQVLGGAGYTREWPVEQALRDARVLEIFEGTTGIQGLDLLHRRVWQDDMHGMVVFVSLARGELIDLEDNLAKNLTSALGLLEETAGWLRLMQGDDRFHAEAGADAFLDLAMLCAQGWIAARLAKLEGDDAVTRRLKASGRYFLRMLAARCEKASAEAKLGGIARCDVDAVLMEH